MNRPYSYTITERYQEITRTGYRKGKCAVCGKSGKRQRTFANTINPFNKNKETGEPKTYDEVAKDVYDDVKRWEAAEPFVHPKCEG